MLLPAARAGNLPCCIQPFLADPGRGWGTHPQVTQQVLSEKLAVPHARRHPPTTTSRFGGQNLGKLGPPYSTTEDSGVNRRTDFSRRTLATATPIRSAMSPRRSTWRQPAKAASALVSSADTNNHPSVAFNLARIVARQARHLRQRQGNGYRRVELDRAHSIPSTTNFENDFTAAHSLPARRNRSSARRLTATAMSTVVATGTGMR